MFRQREHFDGGQGGPATGAAALSLAYAKPGHAHVDPFYELTQREGSDPEEAQPDSQHWFVAIRERVRDLHLVHDLADDIGSIHWFRGLGTMMTLGVAALSFWPDFAAVEAATTLPSDGAVRDEYRSQMIMPLAMGADSGRRMGPTDRVQALAGVPDQAMVKLTATLANGDSFGRMLQRAGVSASDAARATEMVAGTMPLGDIAPGTKVEITLGGRNDPDAARALEKLNFRARFDLGLSLRRSAGALILERQPIGVNEEPLRIRGTVGSGLYRSARSAGAPPRAIQEYLRTLDAHLSLDGDVLPSDQYDMVIGYRRSANGEVQVGKLLYAGLERDGKARVQLVRWKNDQFLDAASMNGIAARPAAPNVVSPVNGRMTSPYGIRRHPVLGYTRMHAGIDYGAPSGAPIFAVTDGTISFAGRHGGHGNYVRIEHGGGLGSGYGHMSRIAVSPGMRVRAGQVVGYVGSTGLSTGPHLHFEVYKNGQTINPLSVRIAATAPTVQIDKAEQDAVKARLVQLRSVKPGAALQNVSFKSADGAKHP